MEVRWEGPSASWSLPTCDQNRPACHPDLDSNPVPMCVSCPSLSFLICGMDRTRH